METELPGITTERTLGRGDVAAQGTEGAYYRLSAGPGESHRRRADLGPGAAAPGRREPLLCLAHVTDMHIVDAESPGRFEFVDRYHGIPAMALLLPTYRPQEFLQLHACAAMIGTLATLARCPGTGAPLDLVLFGGDQVDNAQQNELSWFLRLVQGGRLSPGSGSPIFQGVASADWGDDAYWQPEGAGDAYTRRWGFPSYPGLLQAALRPFEMPGLRLPWLVCAGNHDAFIQGTAPVSPAFERILTGVAKARLSALQADAATAAHQPDFGQELLDQFIRAPEAFLTGPAASIAPDPERRSVPRAAFLRAYRQAGGILPDDASTGRRQTDAACYVVDRWEPVRLIVLDTVNPAGDFQGSIGAAQLAWLEERLIEAHSRYYDPTGRAVRTPHADRPVVLCSHHPLASFTNDYRDSARPADPPRILAARMEAVLHRFPNLVLWVNGHVHRNRVTPHPDPSGRTAGFWEVTTASLFDWPCQARLIEIVANGDGTRSIICTMIDHHAPVLPDPAACALGLAALHREIAANDPYAGTAGGAWGTPADRNVELVVPAPSGG